MSLQSLRKSLRDSRSGQRDGPAKPEAPTAPSGQTAQRPINGATVPLPPDPAVLARVALQSPQFVNSLHGLDVWQQSAVTSPATALVVQAPVGSGKTAVLAHRVLWLHFAHGVPLTQIAALTFTHRAAQELAGRVTALTDCGQTPQELPLFGTFHSVARHLLAHVLPVETLGMTRDFGVVDADQALALLKAALPAAGVNAKTAAAWQSGLRLWQRGAALPKRPKLAAERMPEVAHAYATAKRQANVVDFDDLIALAAELAATTNAAALPRWLLVDELQDCDPTELALLASLRRPETGLFAVGDAHQAIYSWRGSQPEIMAALPLSWPSQTLQLVCNYRSTPQILGAAQAVLGVTGAEPTRPDGALVVVRRHGNAQLEALWLADQCRQLRAAGVAWHQIAILARTKRQLADAAAVLASCAIPCAAADTQAWWTERMGAIVVVADDAGVRLLTFHGTKGLEFQQVFVIGCNQGVSPLASSWQSPAALAEERRLLYVALTRARDGLEIGWHAQAPVRGALGAPSQWLLGLPRTLAQWPEDATPIGPAPSAPGPAARAAETSAARSPWSVGQVVRHPKYGQGQVTAIDDTNVAADFGKWGEKSFSLMLCPLTQAEGA